MAISLSNVNVSIQQFNAVASGKFNAGEVKLTSETTLGKVNNFVTRKWKNNTDLSHEEVLAVKGAFVRALSSSGVVGDELARVRAQLGLAAEPGDAVDRTIGERSIKPLTRQEVREILDRYAGTINASVGPGTIRTADEMNADVSPKERSERADRRNEINTSLARSRTVTSNRDVMLFDRLVAGDLEGIHNDDVSRMLALAREQLASLREKVGDNPPADDRPRVSLQLPGGQTVEIQARGSSAELLAQLEDAEFFLANKPFPREDGTIPPMTPAKWNDRVRWGLDYDDRVRVLQEVNGENVFVPAPPRPLPHEVRLIANELLGEARAKFGDEIIPPGAPVGRLIKDALLEELNRLVSEAGEARRIDMGDLRTVIRGCLMRYGAATAAARRLAATAASLGIQLDADRYGGAVLKRNPALADAIARARNPAEVASALDGCGQAFEKMAAIGARIEAVRESLGERITAALGAKTGLPASSFSGLLFFQSVRQSCQLFTERVATGEVPCESADEAEAAIEAKIAGYVDARTAALAKIDKLGLGKKATEALKAYVFVVNSVNPKEFDLDKFQAIANEIKPDIEALEDALGKPGLETQAGLAAVKTFATALMAAIAKRFDNLDTDGKTTAVNCIFNIALDGVASPAKAAIDFLNNLDYDKLDDVEVDVEITNVHNYFKMAVPSVAEANRRISMTLGTPKLSPFHAGALVRAGRAAGLTAMSEAELLALFAPNKPAGKALADALAAAPTAVSLATLQSLAADALRPFEGEIHDGLAPAALSAVVEG